MAVNNEIGVTDSLKSNLHCNQVIQPISELAKICRDRGVFFHTDAAQGEFS